MSGTVWALLAVRVLLAGLFALAGVAKLADRASFRQAVSDLEMPFAGALSILVPLSELAVAGALLDGRSAWWGAMCTIVLLVAFSAVLGIARVRGRPADCNCFGRVYASSAGWPAIFRNVFLGCLAGLLITAGSEPAGRSCVEAIADLTEGELVALTLGVTAGVTVAAAGLAPHPPARREQAAAGEDRGACGSGAS